MATIREYIDTQATARAARMRETWNSRKRVATVRHHGETVSATA
jgi:hypothetical protein